MLFFLSFNKSQKDGNVGRQPATSVENIGDKFLKSATKSAEDAFIQDSKNDKESKKLFKTLIQEINGSKEYKRMIKDCMTKKRDQVKINAFQIDV